MSLVQPEGAKEGWTCRYEDLRRGVLQADTSVRGSWGLALFLRQGLVAWMHAWPKEQSASEKRAADPLADSTIDFPELSLSLGTQLVLIVADILLHRPREVRT